jgi:hypothetical protein
MFGSDFEHKIRIYFPGTKKRPFTGPIYVKNQEREDLMKRLHLGKIGNLAATTNYSFNTKKAQNFHPVLFYI